MARKVKMKMGYGDAVVIAGKTGYSKPYVRQVLNGDRNNEQIKKEAQKIILKRVSKY